jgi:hypothetical protein
MLIANRGVITGTTTGRTVGDPVFLSQTAGGFVFTAVAGGRRVGTVVTVGAATVGKIDFDGSTPTVPAFLSGLATVPNGTATVTILAATLGGSYGGRPVVSTINAGAVGILSAVWSGNDLVLTTTANVTADRIASYFIGLV